MESEKGKVESGKFIADRNEEPLYTLTSVCNDYEVHIKTKNTCTPDIVTQTETWNRSTYCSPKPQLISTPSSFSPNGWSASKNLPMAFVQ